MSKKLNSKQARDRLLSYQTELIDSFVGLAIGDDLYVRTNDEIKPDKVMLTTALKILVQPTKPSEDSVDLGKPKTLADFSRVLLDKMAAGIIDAEQANEIMKLIKANWEMEELPKLIQQLTELDDVLNLSN